MGCMKICIFAISTYNDFVMEEIWNEICYELKYCIQNNALEKDYEQAVVNAFVLMGWKKFRNEIITQYPVQVGHEKKYADIVVLKDGIEQFVVEIKRPGHILREEDEKQLFSYMRLLKHQVFFGIYISDRICLYYDDDSSSKMPELVFSVDLIESHVKGIQFVELFSKDSIDVSTLSMFCKKQKGILVKQKQIDQEIDRIMEDKDGLLFKNLLKEKYINEGYSVDWADNIINNICLKVSRVCEVDNNRLDFLNTGLYDMQIESNIRTRDKTRYSIMGGEPLAKNRFVLEVVRRYVKENPLPYSEYNRVLNMLRRDSLGVIKTLDKAKKNRYFMDDRFYSSDGVAFVVCTQWRFDNINPVVEFANSMGYQVKVFPG